MNVEIVSLYYDFFRAREKYSKFNKFNNTQYAILRDPRLSVSLSFLNRISNYNEINCNRSTLD